MIAQTPWTRDLKEDTDIPVEKYNIVSKNLTRWIWQMVLDGQVIKGSNKEIRSTKAKEWTRLLFSVIANLNSWVI